LPFKNSSKIKTMKKITKKLGIKEEKGKYSSCCGAPMLKGVQCENCGSNGKFTTGTAIIKRMDKLIDLLGVKKQMEKPKEETAERFIDNGDGTISDTRVMPNGKRLMWQKQGSQERLTYAKAEEFVAELNREEWNDWRLPTREELLTLVDDTKYNPAINPIFKCEPAGYWTSTPYAYYPTDYAWVVGFSGGVTYGYDRYNINYVRPVRQY
jgi:hypothetical protein